MTFATQLLRILLIVVLVASGPGMAAPHVAMSMTPSHAVVADQGCHDHAGMAHAIPGNENGRRGLAQHPKHCSSGVCHCACVHMLPALPGASSQVPVVARAHAISPVARTHPDAARAHLIRPPIG